MQILRTPQPLQDFQETAIFSVASFDQRELACETPQRNTVASGALVLRRLCLVRGLGFEEALELFHQAPEDEE